MMLNLRQKLKDSFASDWQLLTETESIVSRMPEYSAYEGEFRFWRKMLNEEKDFASREIRQEIIALRKELRLRGYDLSLGSLHLVINGFKNDDAMAEGYRRVVLCFCKENVYGLCGEQNHLELGEALEFYLNERNLIIQPEYHYLWFLHTAHEVFLSGAATEIVEHFERLQARADTNPLKILSVLKKL
ncbi:MAG: hypothetical protein ACRC5H_03435 [Treponemataceae bacterium]